ncbi:hypothetical protein [Granulicella tundricola]|nr:hypothetical protein [Granulicella tundricola]
MAEIAATLGTFPPLRIPRVNQYPAGLSYWSVTEHAQKNGGYPVAGWSVAWSPGTLISANDHCVWMREDGTLIDLMAASPGMQGFTTFLMLGDQMAADVDLRYPVVKPNFTIKLTDAPELVEAERRYERWLSLNLKLREMLKKMGWQWNPGSGWFGGNESVAAEMLGQQVYEAQRSFLELNDSIYEAPKG